MCVHHMYVGYTHLSTTFSQKKSVRMCSVSTLSQEMFSRIEHILTEHILTEQKTEYILTEHILTEQITEYIFTENIPTDVCSKT